jgi:hypothetical protein
VDLDVRLGAVDQFPSQRRPAPIADSGQPLGAIQISLGSAQLILCFLVTAYRLLEFGVAPLEFLDL